jgi:hypothetical protein
MLSWSAPHTQGAEDKGAEEHDNTDDQQVQQTLGDDTSPTAQATCDQPPQPPDSH